MLYTLKNKELTVKISSLGAEIQSVTRADGCEYLWQGDAAFWGKRAPVLFPICGRIPNGTYTYRNKKYSLGLHGFARFFEFCMESSGEDFLTFSLSSNEKTREQYPFDFLLTISYHLCGDRLNLTFDIRNNGTEMMPASIGGHPGFRVPINGKGSFGDCFLEFQKPCEPRRIGLTETGFLTGQNTPFALSDGRMLPLARELFTCDAIFLSDTPGSVRLSSRSDPHTVSVEYDGFPYLGFWSLPREGSDFVCIEPWYGLPSPDKDQTDLETKSDMLHLMPGEAASLNLTYTFGIKS